MNVLLLTVFLSTLLAILFLVCFIRMRKDESGSSPEQDALRPFETEKPKKLLRK
jgi:hypothetical protein